MSSFVFEKTEQEREKQRDLLCGYEIFSPLLYQNRWGLTKMLTYITKQNISSPLRTVLVFLLDGGTFFIFLLNYYKYIVDSMHIVDSMVG